MTGVSTSPELEPTDSELTYLPKDTVPTQVPGAGNSQADTHL